MVEKQARLMSMLARLILHAEALGYQITGGDLYRDPRATFPYSHPDSLHAQRLAVDLNLFLHGEYLTTVDDYMPLGLYWESLGGTWGGRFDDAPHFSLANAGMK